MQSSPISILTEKGVTGNETTVCTVYQVVKAFYIPPKKRIYLNHPAVVKHSLHSTLVKSFYNVLLEWYSQLNNSLRCYQGVSCFWSGLLSLSIIACCHKCLSEFTRIYVKSDKSTLKCECICKRNSVYAIQPTCTNKLLISQTG